MNPSEKAAKTLSLMGGAETVLNEIDHALNNEEDQWAAELCDILLDSGEKVDEAKRKKAEALMHMGRTISSANGRHYYIACAKELAGTGTTQIMNGAAADVEKK